MKGPFDCVVLGAGPAGLSASFYLSRAGRRVAVVDPGPPGGKCRRLGRITNHPAFPGGILGARLAARLERQARAHGARFVRASAERVERVRGGYAVRWPGRVLRARAVIVATGTDFSPLGVEGESRLFGRGVHHAPFDAAPRWRGRSVAVVGGGEAAAHQALGLARAGARVRLWVRGTGVRAVLPLRRAVAAEARVRVESGVRVAGLEGRGRLRGVWLEGPAGRRLEPVESLFVLVGQRPRLPDLPAPGPGLYTAGDAAGLPRQTSVAAASGLERAMAADAFLGGI